MKSITEFANFTLNQGLKTKATLTADGKTPEEIQTALGEAFKYEGDKLKHFVNSLEVATQNPENLKRVLVVSFAEGEKTPPKAVKVEETHYVPDFIVQARAPAPEASEKGGRGGKGGRGKERGPKESPWGLSPEEKAAKIAARRANKKGEPAAAAKTDKQ